MVLNSRLASLTHHPTFSFGVWADKMMQKMFEVKLNHECEVVEDALKEQCGKIEADTVKIRVKINPRTLGLKCILRSSSYLLDDSCHSV